jgi:hypothetical protein
MNGRMVGQWKLGVRDIEKLKQIKEFKSTGPRDQILVGMSTLINEFFKLCK